MVVSLPGEHDARRWGRLDEQPVRQHPLQPDLLVALDVEDKNRDYYDLHIEGKPPDMVAEFLSPSSLQADQIGKLEAYSLLGIREYWIFNPAGAFPLPYIQAWTLHGERDPEPLLSEGDGSIASRVLPVRFVVRSGLLDVLDQTTGEPLSSQRTLELQLGEEISVRQREAAALQQETIVRLQGELENEAAARLQAELEIERLRAEVERLRRERWH